MEPLDTLIDPDIERKIIGHLFASGRAFKSLFHPAAKANDFTVPDCRAAFVELETHFGSDCPEEDLQARLWQIAQKYAPIGKSAEEPMPSMKVWIQRLNDLSCRRTLLDLAQKAGEKALNPNCDLKALLDHLIEGAKLLSGRWIDPRREPISDGLMRILAEFEQDYETRGKPRGIPSGFHALDALTSGFMPGNLYLIGGVAGGGKTTFALSIAKRALRENRIKVSFSAIRENIQNLLRPLLWQLSGVESKQIREGRLTHKDFDNLIGTAYELTNGKLDLRVNRKRTLMEIRSQATQLSQGQGLKLLIIDDAERLADETVPFDRVCVRLRALARKRRIPVVAFCKLEHAHRDEYEPWKQTGVYSEQLFELAADTVMRLKQNPNGSTELKVIRNVGGSTGSIQLQFNGQSISFSENE